MSRPDNIIIDGRAYRWRDIVELRRQQLEAWKAARPEQPALFALKADSRPAVERTAITDSPLASSNGMTLFQLEPSAQAPCTSTIVAVDFVMMASP